MATRGAIFGVIMLVQERRFQLEDGAGVRHLFLMASEAPIDQQQLKRCADRRSRVRVHYRLQPGLLALVAEEVEV